MCFAWNLEDEGGWIGSLELGREDNEERVEREGAAENETQLRVLIISAW